MPLATNQDDKLIVQDGKLCTSCCNQGSSLGCCYVDIGDGTLQSQIAKRHRMRLTRP